MASTFSDLKIELIGTGEQVGTWGVTTNANLGTAIEEAIVGSASVSFSSADVTLTLTNTNGTQSARHLRLNLTGTSGGARNLILGSGCQIDKPYIINNGLADTVTVKNTTGTGVAVPAGKSMWVYNNGTNVVDVTTHASSLTLGSALPVASGGTGVTSPGTAGNVLTSNGTIWTSATPNPFITGMIMLWSGSIASIPSGWALCDGTSGTPNLRDRFIVGAGSTYAVNATGGSTTTTATGSISGTVAGTSLTEAQMPKHYHQMVGPNSVTAPQNNQGGYGIFGGGTPDDTALSYGTWSVGGSAASGSQSTGTGNGDSHTHGFSATFSGNAVTSLPPYYALAYIMKL